MNLGFSFCYNLVSRPLFAGVSPRQGVTPCAGILRVDYLLIDKYQLCHNRSISSSEISYAHFNIIAKKRTHYKPFICKRGGRFLTNDKTKYKRKKETRPLAVIAIFGGQRAEISHSNHVRANRVIHNSRILIAV